MRVEAHLDLSLRSTDPLPDGTIGRVVLKFPTIGKRCRRGYAYRIRITNGTVTADPIAYRSDPSYEPHAPPPTHPQAIAHAIGCWLEPLRPNFRFVMAKWREEPSICLRGLLVSEHNIPDGGVTWRIGRLQPIGRSNPKRLPPGLVEVIGWTDAEPTQQESVYLERILSTDLVALLVGRTTLDLTS
jgi:hypothetical protein